ncbi:hypothetical protein FM112_01205 [Gulosibacter sp. 10]|nr:hypothetical protein FM112_01205 [Gulosibacter sp. 10]
MAVPRALAARSIAGGGVRTARIALPRTFPLQMQIYCAKRYTIHGSATDCAALRFHPTGGSVRSSSRRHR